MFSVSINIDPELLKRKDNEQEHECDCAHAEQESSDTEQTTES